jgi:hypothetical protein
MESEKNIYGLSEGVYKACQYLGLEFPAEAPNDGEHIPSDYFGADFEFDSETIEKLRTERKWDNEKYEKTYKSFSEKFASQQPLKQTRTDLNVYFCDYILFVESQLGTAVNDYFDFEFYNKSFELRRTFLVRKHSRLRLIICNENPALKQVSLKWRANQIFAEFLHRDWLNTETCSFERFKLFVAKHKAFFAKPTFGMQGKETQIIQIKPEQNLKQLFTSLKSKKLLIEEIIVQHEALRAFCPDTVNTIRVNTLLDIHNAVHILTTSGRFGRVGNIVDNFHSGGFSVTIDPKTGIVISDGLNRVHERAQIHPDTGKTFKGFQYPSWDKLRAAVIKMAKLVPQVRHIGWDIAINAKGEPVFVEANNAAAADIQQAPDSIGRLYLYKPLLDELQKDKDDRMRRLGYQINAINDLEASYYSTPARQNSRLRQAVSKLIPDCTSLIDVGCRKAKYVKSLCHEDIQYFPIDYKKHDDEVIKCDFNTDDFHDITADTCLCAFTAEYVEQLPTFLDNMCRAAQKQILMWCRPVDKEIYAEYRYFNPFLTDFTEKFLITTMEKNNFKLDKKYPDPKNPCVILYDFRRV